MAGRGPAPTPTGILELRGSKEAKRRRRKKEPRPTAGAPSCPTWLSREAKAEWKRVVGGLECTGVLTQVDRAVFAGYCQAWADYHELVREVRRDGRTFETKQGYIAKNPKVTMMNEARLAYLKFAQDLGLTPSARTRLQVEKPKDDPDDLRRFFRGAAG